MHIPPVLSQPSRAAPLIKHIHLSAVKPTDTHTPREKKRDSRGLKSVWVRFSHGISYNNKLLVCSFLEFRISGKAREPAPVNS